MKLFVAILIAAAGWAYALYPTQLALAVEKVEQAVMPKQSYFFDIKGGRMGLMIDESDAHTYAKNNPKKYQRIYRCNLEEVRWSGQFQTTDQ